MINQSIKLAFERLWYYILTIPHLPIVTNEDNDKMLMVVDGEWVATTIPIAEEESV